MRLKNRKSILTRFKFTRRGKILRRAIGQDHFLAKKSGKKRRSKRKWVRLSAPETKKIKRILRG